MHRIKILRQVKKYRKLHPEKRPMTLKRLKGYYYANKSKIVKTMKEHRIKIKTAAIAILGDKCACPGCNETNIKFLTIDHVHNNGARHRKQIGNSSNKLHQWIVDSPHRATRVLRLLCWNCNCGRAVNSGICPHIDRR